jgi:hypothetical protein
MSDLVTRYVFDDDYTAEKTWGLLAWCIAHGADEFSLSLVSIAREPAPACDAFERALADAARGIQARRVQSGPHAKVADVPVWSLTPRTAAVLRSVFADTLLHYEVDMAGGWFEDPIFWRQGEVMLAVVSHEQEGALILTEAEHTEAQAIGYPSRSVGTWISH